MPSAAEIDVDEWPTPKVSYSVSSRLGNGATPSFCLTVWMRVAAAGEDLVRVALVADVPDQAVHRRVVQPVQGDGEFDHAQAGAEVAADLGDLFDQVGAQFVGDRRAVPLRGTGADRREPGCGKGAGSAAGRSLRGTCGSDGKFAIVPPGWGASKALPFEFPIVRRARQLSAAARLSSRARCARLSGRAGVRTGRSVFCGSGSGSGSR